MSSSAMPRRRPRLPLVLPLVMCLSALLLTLAAKAKPQQPLSKKKTDPFDNTEKNYFWLTDPRTAECLGPHGFAMCDGSTAWILAERKEGNVLVTLLEHASSDMCLERKWCHSPQSPVSIGPCKSCGSKHWAIERDSRGYVRVSEDKGKNCLVRSKPGGKGKFKRYKNSVEMQHCSVGYTGLLMQPVPFSEGGFLLQAADGFCFDGARFRPCDLRDYNLRWAVGVRFTGSGQGERFFYLAYKLDVCLTRTSKGPQLGACNVWGAKRWSIKDGQLSQGDGQWCVVRHYDNSAGFEKCSLGSEFISAVPHDPGAGGAKKPITAGIGY